MWWESARRADWTTLSWDGLRETSEIFQKHHGPSTLVYEPTLRHPNQDSPEDDVEGGGVLKENLEAEEGEQLQLTSQFSIDPIRGQKQEDQAMQGTKDACKKWLCTAHRAVVRSVIS